MWLQVHAYIYISFCRLDPKYLKAYYRRASANFALGKYKEAKNDLKKVIASNPKDPDAKKKLAACEAAIQVERFTKAIESDTPTAESASLDVDSITVESSYAGPSLGVAGVEGITMDFVHEMISHFRGLSLPPTSHQHPQQQLIPNANVSNCHFSIRTLAACLFCSTSPLLWHIHIADCARAHTYTRTQPQIKKSSTESSCCKY